jgi:hypothetical protein
MLFLNTSIYSVDNENITSSQKYQFDSSLGTRGGTHIDRRFCGHFHVGYFNVDCVDANS